LKKVKKKRFEIFVLTCCRYKLQVVSFFTGESGGVVTVRRVPRKQYLGSYRNRISSSSYIAQSGSFSFEPGKSFE